MKHSPLCSRDDGHEIMFTAKDGDQKLRFTLSRDMLDTTCGAAANEAARKSWVKDHMPDILALRTASVTPTAPFNRVRVEEIA
ncbi:hypothetical protein [Loktanella sp. Alg231-35]|uniref:hypothetical protein n=1 Tax=Loktanella sp. Alg231-35 TaxID=1922220 RepID=UPI000D5511C3|nr:hypothetical protein [Loktanella sp. Alg231-35]